MSSKRSFLLILTSIISFTCFSQGFRYFSSGFQSRVDVATPYQRKYFHRDTAIYVEDSNRGILEFSGTINTTNTMEADDFALYARTLGVDSLYKNSFVNLRGSFRYYKDNGALVNELYYNGKHLRCAQAWTPDGKEMLSNGNGVHSYFDAKNKEFVYTLYKDSLLAEDYVVRQATSDTIHLHMDQPARPKEGFNAFADAVKKIAKDPTVSKLKNSKGFLYLQFTVEGNGNLTDFKAMVDGPHRFMDYVRNKLNRLPDWNPAVHQGRVVKSRYILPIQYRVRNQRNLSENELITIKGVTGELFRDLLLRAIF